MKIAILAPISYSLPPKGYAPWEKVVHTLANGLVERGMDVTVFAAQDSSSATYRIQTTVDKSLQNIEEFKFQQEMIHIAESIRLFNKGEYDLIHNNLNWYGQAMLQSSGLKFITTIHGFESPSKKYFEYYKNSNYISISYAQRNESADLNYIGNVYNGIDFDLFELDQNKQDYFFLAARICKDKGIHHAINLAKQTNTKLFICGIIQEQEYFENEVKPHIDNTLISFFGDLSQKEVKKYVAKAKAYISILEFDEPFGLSVGEAIACGTPIIANKRGSMVELVKDGISGILVDDVQEAIARVDELENIEPATCRKYGERLFSVPIMIDGYIEAYNKAL